MISLLHHHLPTSVTRLGNASVMPVEPNVSMAKYSPSSMRVASPPFTIGTLLPAWIWYGAMLWPFRLRTGFTCRMHTALPCTPLKLRQSPV